MNLFDGSSRKRKTKPGPVGPKAAKAGDGIKPRDHMFDAMADAENAPNRPLLYMFQYVALPKAAFQNHPELMRELEGERSSPPLLHFLSKAHLLCVQAGLIDANYGETDAALNAELQLFKPVAVHTHKRAGYTAHVVTMPPPQFIPEAYFAAIVHKDDEPKAYMRESPSTRYFTLEKSQKRLPVLCECRRDGSRRNYGEGPAPELAAFVDAVFERVAATQPSSNRILLDGGSAAVMMFAPPSSTDYHLVSVEFEDGTRVSDAKVYHRCELELPPQFKGKKIKRLAINARQP